MAPLPVPVLGLDPDGVVDLSNDHALSLMGLESLIGRNIGELAWDVDGDPATLPAPGRIEWSVRDDRGWRILDGQVGARDDGGRLVVLREITRERLASELLEDRKDVMEALGTGRPLDEVLERIAELVRYGIPGALCAILAYDETGDELRVRAAPGLDSGEQEQLRSGRPVPGWTLVPIHSSLGSNLGLLALRIGPDELNGTSDEVVQAAVQLSGSAITARRADAALHQAQKLESLGLLAGGIAHDFNNLLTSALGNLELLHDQVGVASPLYTYLSRVERSTRKAAELTRQLLTYSGRNESIPRRVDVGRLLEETRSLLEGTVANSVQVSLEVNPRVPTVLADEAQLQQVVMNLALNAAEATGGSPGHVVLALRSTALDAEAIERSFSGQALSPGTFVEVEVRDDGCGMDAKTIGRIFDPFFTTKFTGRGLGLAATAGVIRALRGGIWIRSDLGEGSTFRVLLPAASQPADRSPVAKPEVPLFGEGRVLVVDDEQDVRQLVATVLGASGFDVVQAADGKDAVETYQRQGPFELIVMDLTMPRMGGGEALDRIRDIDPDVPCLLAGGYPEGEAPQGDHNTRFIQKPFRLSRLKSSIAALLGGREE
ncbi:MAG: response regulator [Proteobacteria bacterium]|nr:response regulator [Pseudomonadota bacterium]